MTSRDRPDIDEQMIKAMWRNLPSPWEIDVRDEAAARKLIRAILKARAE